MLVNSAREGTFVLEPQHDILVEAIRTKEYGECVRGVGYDIVLGVFFGTSKKITEFDEKLQAERETRRK